MGKQNRHNEEVGVRSLLEGYLRGRFAEETWNKMLRDGHVKDYLDGDEKLETLRELAEDALEFQRRLERELLEKRGMSEPSSEKSSLGPGASEKSESFHAVFDVQLPEREQKRAAVLLEIQMRRAAEHPGVERFRRERLGDRLLAADEAETYFTPHPRQAIRDRELADLGERLKRHYGWHRDDAAWFVLTGEPPALRPLAASFFDNVSPYGPRYCELTLRVAPWVPAEEVKKAFERMRDQVRGGLGPGTVGEQRLEVLRFVEAERAKSGRRPTGEALIEMWNREYPHWSYANYRALLKAYREARKEVIYPEYHLPDRAKTPNMKRQAARELKRLEAANKRDAHRPPPKSVGDAPVRLLE